MNGMRISQHSLSNQQTLIFGVRWVLARQMFSTGSRRNRTFSMGNACSMGWKVGNVRLSICRMARGTPAFSAMANGQLKGAGNADRKGCGYHHQ